MQRIARTLGTALVLLAVATAGAQAGDFNGTLKLGVITKDETAGDLTAIQETYNIYDGFSVSQVRLNGRLGRKHYFNFDLNEINLDSRRGSFAYTVPDVGKLTARYDRYRQLYDMDGSTTSMRENWRLGGVLTPSKTFRITGDYSIQNKTGDRLGYPSGTASFLGSQYDYDLQTGNFEVEARRGSRGLAAGYQMSRFQDGNLDVAKRKGDIFYLRANGSDYFFPTKVSHFLRGSYGKQKLTEVDLDYQLGTFQYLGTVRPSRAFQFQYRLDLSRVDNMSTGFKTDLVRNDFDLTWYNKIGRLFGGYGYVTNDDDVTLTSYNVWRVGGAAAYGKWVNLKLSYASSEKEDQAKQTLLKDIESSRLRASIHARPSDPLTLGVSYVDRVREFPVIRVKATGQRYSAYGRYAEPGLGALNVDYSYANEEYIDRVAGFEAENHTVTARLDVERIKDLRLSAGVTYLDIGKDLDIEKSILMFEGNYTFLKDYFVEVKYNVYNYDDYVLLDRYYTANVVWLNVGYNLSID